MQNQNYEELLQLRQKITQSYFKIYSDFEIKDSIDIDEDKDITLDFINCTICLAKDNLSKQIRGKDYVMIQPCLRNNHTNLLSSYSEQSNYLSYFTMLGGFHYIEHNNNLIYEFNNIVVRQFNFFQTIKDKCEIRLTIPIQYSNFLPLLNETKELILNNNGNIIYSIADEKNLKWKYGIDNIVGYGTRWEIKNIDGLFINCGNDIILFSDDNAIGIDFGSGLETLVSIINGKTNLLYSNKVCSDYIKEFCNGNKLNEKLIDALLSLICCEYYKKRKNVRIKYLVFIYMRIISAISIINDINEETMIDLMKEICKNIDIKGDDIILETINKLEKQNDFLYKISSSDNVTKALKYFEKENNKYERKLLNIEIYALKKIIKKEENNYAKTKKIKKRRQGSDC